MKWVSLLFLSLAVVAVPLAAQAEGLGSVVLGATGGPVGLVLSTALTLASVFHVWDKLGAIIQRAKAPATTIAGHPKLTEALDALEQAGMHVLQDVVTPDLLAQLGDKLKGDSLANVGAWLATTYGPKLLADLKEQGESLLGSELRLIFGGDKAVEDAALLRLGVAASKTVATQNHMVQLASGRLLAVPGAA